MQSIKAIPFQKPFLSSISEKIKENEDYSIQGTYLHYMSGARAGQFKSLYERGILDIEGNLTPKWKNFKLPPLLESEVLIIKRELFKKFTWKIDENFELELSIGFLVRLLSKKYSIASKHLIGGYVVHFLMTKTNYAERVFAEMGAADLYDGRCFSHEKQGPADIDLRLHIKNTSEEVPLETKDFLEIQSYLSHCLTERYCLGKDLTNEEKNAIYNKIFAYFLQHPPIITETNRFLETSFKESPIDCILFNRLARTHVLTLDDLYLPVEALFEETTRDAVTPQSHRGEPLESFLHVYLGLIKAKKRSKIDVKGWFRYIGALTKGNYSAQKASLEIPLEQQLFHTMFDVWCKHGRESGIIKFNLEIGKWIRKHYENNPEAAFAFILTAAHYLENYLDPKEIQLVTEDHLASLTFESTAPREIQIMRSLLIDDHIPIPIVLSVVQLAGFLNASRANTSFTIVSQDFQRPALQFVCNNRNMQLRLAPELALNNLLNFRKNQEDRFDNAEQKLADLFFILYPFSKGYSLPNNFLVDALLNDDLLTLGTVRNVFPLVESESLFLKRIALLFIIHMPFLDERARISLAIKHFHEFSSLEEIGSYFGQIIGINTISSSDSSTLMEMWVKALMADGKLQEIGYGLWKSALQQKETSATFSLNLIESLSVLNPSISLQMLSYLRQQQLLSQEALVRLRNLCHITGNTQEHQRLRELAQEELHKLTHSTIPSLIDDFQNLELNTTDATPEETSLTESLEDETAIPSLIDERPDSHKNSTVIEAEKLLDKFGKGKGKKLELVENFIAILESPGINLYAELKKECLNALIKILSQTTTKLRRTTKQGINKIIAASHSLLSNRKQKRRLISLCETKGFSIGSQAGDFWIDTLNVWAAESPDQIKNIYRLFKYGEQQGLYDPSSDLVISFKLNLAGILDETNPLKMNLLTNLIEICSKLEDIQILMNLLVDMLKERTALVRKFQLLDQYLDRNPAMTKRLTTPMLEALTYLQKSNALDDLEKILALPSFHGDAWPEREKLVDVVRFTVTSLVERSDKTPEKIEALNDLINVFHDNLTGIDAKFWVGYLKYLIYTNPQLALDPFVRVFNSKFLENNPYELQYTYYNLIFELSEKECRVELSFFADYYAVFHELIFQDVYDPFLSFSAHCCIIRAICRGVISRLHNQEFSVHFSENVQQIRNAFQSNGLANEYLVSSILSNPSYDAKQKEECLIVKEEIDLLLIELQFRTKHPTFIKDGSEVLKCHIEAKKPKIVNCPSNDPWPIAAALCTPMHPQPFEVLDLLLPLIIDFNPGSVDVNAVCNFLIQHPTVERLNHALDIWYGSTDLFNFLEQEKESLLGQPLNKEWKMLLRLTSAIYELKDPDLMKKVISVFKTFSLRKNELFSCLGQKAKLQYSEVVLKKLSTFLETDDHELYQIIINEVMLMLEYLKNPETAKEILEALPHGIAAIAIYNYDMFLNLAGTYQALLSKTAKIKSARMLPRMQRYTLRKHFLEAILDVASNHSLLKSKLIEYVKENVKYLLNEFKDNEFKAGNMELFKKIVSLEAKKK